MSKLSMNFCWSKYFPFLRKLPAMLLCAAYLCASAVIVSSCGGSKKSASIRQIEKQSKKYGDSWKSKEVKKAEAKQKKQEQEAAKEAEKQRKDALTRHREFQTQETRDRMDQHLKEANKKYGTQKGFFLVRWFKPKDDIAKIEKRRAAEVKKRMAATLKKAQKNNNQRSISSFKTKKRKFEKPDPDNVQQGGGGSHTEGNAKRYANPADIQQGGGGSYTEGKTKSTVKASDMQQGGGGNMSGNSKKNRKKQKT